ncbi:hypothetical protein B1F73_21710 [Pseudomonas syringae]|uniref:Uncharacterized protein n=1 Tax=Pseudomonas syringae TaxID=317 RepID=A0AB37ZDN9_PSESX|nr:MULTISPECIES: hypothetical protein [Pseudomonas]MBI6666613.1 hypothetical protein [Pseudomonas syringae]MBI6679146.1 hypothetical protein [Pseudomonas syringae]MBI6839963.1 hypothetical protein [Pseudomonas syringae]NAP02807.1 hypothetical protein [Pseudomonas syringae]NAP18591.1 hypothetical protein [Pseudomonas syringae]
MPRRKRISDEDCELHLRDKWRAILSLRLAALIQTHEKVTLHLIEEAIDRLASIYRLFGEHKDPHFNKEIMSNSASYDQRMSEILFYYHLRRGGFTDLESNKKGPDFFCKKNNREYYFEVVTPTPNPNHLDWIQDGIKSSENAPQMYVERRRHIAKTIGRKVNDYLEYIEDGTIPSDATYVIVMNDTFLHPYNEPWFGANLSQPLAYGHAAVPVIANVTLGAMDIRFNELNGTYLHREEGAIYTKESKYISSSGISINGNRGNQPDITIMRGSETPKSIEKTLDIALLDTQKVSGFYQLTLREDLVFLDRVSAHIGQNISNPSSALAVRKENSENIIEDIPHFYLYRDDLPFTSVSDPFLILGLRGSDMFSKGLKSNLDFIHENLYKKTLNSA